MKVDERQFLTIAVSEDSPVLPTVTQEVALAKSTLIQRLYGKAHYHANVAVNAIRHDIQEESARGTAFLFVPVWLGLGSIIYFIAEFEPSFWSLVVLLLALVTIRTMAKRLIGAYLVFTILLLITLGAGFAKVQTWRNATPMLAGEITTEITARVVSINPAAKSHRAILEIIQTAKPTLKYAPRRVRVTLRQGAGQLTAGNIITVRVRLMPPSGPVRPTSYDFAFQAYFDGIGASGFSISPVTLESSQDAPFLDRVIATMEQLRQTIAMRIRAVIKGSEGEVAVALIAGVQVGIDEATIEPLRITGLAHILSISGLHMALVAGLFMVTVRGAFALFPTVSARLPVKKYAAALALLASFFYLLLSGADVAATRSFLMLAVFLVAILFDQKALTMRNLTIAAIAILVVTPHEIMGPSFQMSFAATAALISAYAYWSNVKSIQNSPQYASFSWQLWDKAWRTIGALSMTSIIAGTATALFSAWHFHRLAPMGLPTNLAAMAPVSFIVMPSAVIGALAMPFGLEQWPLKAMGFGLGIVLDLSKFFANLSSAGLSGALNPVPFLIATGALLAACLLQTRLKWIAILPVPIFVFLFSIPTKPDILISEDAKLVAVRLLDNTLAVNQNRPNGFTIEVWKKALLAKSILTPILQKELNPSSAFVCEDIKCTATLNNGRRLTWIGYPKLQRAKPELGDANQPVLTQVQIQSFTDRAAIEAIWAAKYDAIITENCGKADLLILAGPTPVTTCQGANTSIISAKDLAMHGTIEVYLTKNINTISKIDHSNYEKNNQQLKSFANETAHDNWFTIRTAIGEPNRPWNVERKFSRAARNLPPFQPIPRTKPIQ